MKIVDSFGIVTDAHPTTDVDPLQRGFEVFTLSPSEPTATTDGSLFYLPNNLWHGLESALLEEVTLFRDEYANFCWAVEHKVTVGGQLIARDEPASTVGAGPEPRHYWDSQSGQMIERPLTFPDGEPGNDIQGPLALYLESRLPPRNWVPYVQQLRNGKVVLRRARTYVDTAPQFLGEIIKESHAIAEEEVPLHGITVARIYQLARDCDGRRIVWKGRKKRPGRFSNPSNLAFDLLVEEKGGGG